MEGAALLGGLAQPARLEWRAARVVGTRTETPRVRTLVLDVPGWPGHRAGQHLDLRLTAEDGYQAQRSYSIASTPGGRHVEITVERLSDGEVSPYLTDVVQDGDLLEVRGPIGGYFIWAPDASRPLALVAGGSGIVPLMCMLRYRESLRATSAEVPPSRLLYSTRSAEDAIYRAELDGLAADGLDAELRVAYTLTRSQPAGWSGYRRRIDREMLADALWTPAAVPLCYVCGPTPMVESVASLLVALGYPPTDIRTERFGPTGGGAP
jgi:ferredoxin-NADP reductase